MYNYYQFYNRFFSFQNINNSTNIITNKLKGKKENVSTYTARVMLKDKEVIHYYNSNIVHILLSCHEIKIPQ